MEFVLLCIQIRNLSSCAEYDFTSQKKPTHHYKMAVSVT